MPRAQLVLLKQEHSIAQECIFDMRLAEESLWSFNAYFQLNEDYLNVQGNSNVSFFDIVSFMSRYQTGCS